MIKELLRIAQELSGCQSLCCSAPLLAAEDEVLTVRTMDALCALPAFLVGATKGRPKGPR